MKVGLKGCVWQTATLLIILLIGAGCSAVPLPDTGVTSSLADLLVQEDSVKLIHGDQSELELEKESSTALQVNERVQLDEKGQGLVRFQDSLEVALFGKTEIQLTDAIIGSDGSAFVELYQTYGNAIVQLNDEANARVTLVTEYATIRTLKPGSEFIICHKPEAITCGVVYQGIVEFTAQGRQEIAHAGEAIYIKPDQPPSPAICARLRDVDEWVDQVRGGEQVPGLGQLVASWPQEPCAPAAAIDTQAPSEDTPAPSDTPQSPTGTTVQGTNTPTLTSTPTPTNTSRPTTRTLATPTNTRKPRNVSEPPTSTPEPATDTLQPSDTSQPPTSTPAPPTATRVPPTNTAVPPTPVPATDTPEPPPPPDTDTPEPQTTDPPAPTSETIP